MATGLINQFDANNPSHIEAAQQLAQGVAAVTHK